MPELLNVHPVPTVTRPMNRLLAPVVLLSVSVAVPVRVVELEAMKLLVLRFKEPDKAMAPPNVTVPVVPQVIVPSMVEVPATVVAAVPERFKVVPAGTERFPENNAPAPKVQVVFDKRTKLVIGESVPLKVTVPAVLSKDKVPVAVAAPVKVTAPVPVMVCAPVKVTAPKPLWLKAPVTAIPP